MATREEVKKDLETRTAAAQALMGDLTKVDEFNKIMGEVRTLGEMLEAMDTAERRQNETRKALAEVPAPPIVAAAGWAEVRKSFIAMARGEARAGNIPLSLAETRAITSNGAGVGSAPGIAKALVDGGKLRSKVSVFTGANASTVVPVFAPHLALPAGQTPGGTGIGADSTAALTGDSLTLKPWYSILAASMGALIATDIEGYLPGIIEESFGGAIDKGIIVGAGSGNDMLGVFVASASGVTTSQDIACAAAGAPKWADIVKLAGQILGLGGDLSKAAIVLHPDFVGGLLTEATASTEGLKMELLTKGTVRGIRVVESSYCPTTLTAGSYVAVGGYFNHYALAVAQELTIDQIKTVGSDNVTFQSFMYIQGKPIVASSFRRLKTV